MTLAIDDLRAEPSSILLVEWGDKFEKIVSESGAEIAIERTGDSERLILHR
jgi:tRNA A37 threonylcarbamoyladenosine biosynthesis protein TsaE